VDTGTKEEESSTGRVWAAGFYHVTARSQMACFLKFLKIILLLSPFDKLHQTLFYLPILFLKLFFSAMFQMHL
jgi:hypothetical protein